MEVDKVELGLTEQLSESDASTLLLGEMVGTEVTVSDGEDDQVNDAVGEGDMVIDDDREEGVVLVG